MKLGIIPLIVMLLSIGMMIMRCNHNQELTGVRSLKMVSVPMNGQPVDASDSSLNTLLKQGNRNIVISKPIHISENLEIPYGYALEIQPGGIIFSEKQMSLHIYGNFSAGNLKVFDGNLKVKFGAGSVEKVNVNWFGALADTQLVIGEQGEDDTDQIQNAIESAEFVRNVYFPAYRPSHFKWYGAYRISRTIQARIKGKKFLGISLFGEESYDRPKSVIYADFNEGGAINIQSARGSVIAYLAIAGKNMAPEKNKEKYSASLSDYITDGVKTEEKNAYSGITIDGNAKEPGSANTIIKYCRISRFYVGINISAAGETQGDMLSIEHNALEYNAFHITLGNSQARSISIYRCDIGRGHTVLDNLSFGAKLGSTVNFSHNQITNCFQLLNYTTAAAGPSEMSGNYGENLGRIGKVLGGRNQNTLTIRDGTFKFAPTGYEVETFFEGQAKLVINSCLIQVNGKENLAFQNTQNTKFENTRFRGKKGMPTISGENLEFVNCTVSNSYREETIRGPIELRKK